LDGNDLRDFRNVVSKISLDPLLQSHVTARTAMARSMKPNLHHALPGDINQFDVSAIGLHSRPDQVDDILNPLAHGWFAR
jgi:hypothetical protein